MRKLRQEAEAHRAGHRVSWNSSLSSGKPASQASVHYEEQGRSVKITVKTKENDTDSNSQPGNSHLVMVPGLFACLCELCCVLTSVRYNTNIFGQTLLERFQLFFLKVRNQHLNEQIWGRGD